MNFTGLVVCPIGGRRVRFKPNLAARPISLCIGNKSAAFCAFVHLCYIGMLRKVRFLIFVYFYYINIHSPTHSKLVTGHTALVSSVLLWLVSQSTNSQYQKRKQYKSVSRQHIQILKEQSEGLSMKNKFIAALTHEIRNIVTKYSSRCLK